jgi:hypothetical protein
MGEVYGESTRLGGGSKTEPTSIVELFMAGDIEHAKQVIRRFCKDRPCCVTVTPTTYIYRGGEEAGFVIGFRNYPRFPSGGSDLLRLASDLGQTLRDCISQDSFMVVEHGGQTEWSTERGS